MSRSMLTVVTYRGCAMVPIERSHRLPTFDFIQNAPLSPNGDIIDFAASDDDLRISKTSQSGPMVYAVVGDDPYVETRQMRMK